MAAISAASATSSRMDLVDIDINSKEDSVELDLYLEGACGIQESGRVSGKDNEDRKVTKKRKLTSKVWQVFERLPLGSDNIRKSKCKGCGKIYMADSKYGTGNMARHMKSCVRLRNMDMGQMLIEFNGSTRPSKFCHETFQELVISAIIRHQLPFQLVEYDGIKEVFNYLNADLKHITRNTIKNDVLKLHARELSKLSMLLHLCPGRICLTTELWTSVATDTYLCLTAYFIDKDWVLQRRILNFSYVPPPYSGVAFSEKVYNLLRGWGIEKRLFSITMDNASANHLYVDLLKTQLSMEDALVSDGSFFHIPCCAHILKLIVQEGLKTIDDCVGKIRDCIKYVKGSQVRNQKFLECVAHVSLNCKRALRQDVPMRWNSTFLMLSGALYYQCAFCHLRLSDSNFKHCPSLEEWDKIEKTCKFLELFYDVTCVFSGTKQPTTNLYFPQAFVVQLTLSKEIQSSDDFLRNMAKQMFGMFNKYWSEYSLILAIAVIFDPRYKIQFVEFCYNKLYGEGSFENMLVREKLFSLFDEYIRRATKVSCSPSTSHASDESNPRSLDRNEDRLDVLKEFDVFASQKFVTSVQKSQLELYLNEKRIDRKTELDVLTYWKAYQYRYPELANMARDVLSIPISTAASEFAFSMDGQVLNEYSSSLRPDIVEALVCTKDWLFGDGEFAQVALDDLTEDVMSLNIHKGEFQAVGCSNELVNLET